MCQRDREYSWKDPCSKRANSLLQKPQSWLFLLHVECHINISTSSIFMFLTLKEISTIVSTFSDSWILCISFGIQCGRVQWLSMIFLSSGDPRQLFQPKTGCLDPSSTLLFFWDAFVFQVFNCFFNLYNDPCILTNRLSNIVEQCAGCRVCKVKKMSSPSEILLTAVTTWFFLQRTSYFPLFPRGSISKKYSRVERGKKPYCYGKTRFMDLSLTQIFRVNYTIQQTKNTKTIFKVLLSMCYEHSKYIRDSFKHIHSRVF